MSGWWVLLGATTILGVLVALLALRAVQAEAVTTVETLDELARVEISAVDSSSTLGRVEHQVKRSRQPTAPADTPR